MGTPAAKSAAPSVGQVMETVGQMLETADDEGFSPPQFQIRSDKSNNNPAKECPVTPGVVRSAPAAKETGFLNPAVAGNLPLNPAVMAHHSNGQNNGEDTDDDEVMEVDQEGQSIKESIKAPTQDNPPPSPLPQVIVTNDQQQPPKEASLDNQAVTATPVVTIHSEETNPNVTTQKETTHAAGSVQDETRAGIFDSIQKYQKLEEKRKKEDKEAATETIDEIIGKTDAEARAASAPVSRAVSTGLEIDQVTETKKDHETKPFRGLFARAARQSDQVTETVHETKQVGLFDSTEPFPRPYRDRTGQFRHKTGAE